MAPCVTLIDPFFHIVSGESLPAPCSGCTRIDYRVEIDGNASRLNVGTTAGTVAAGDHGLLSGMIMFIDTGSCPAGWTELSGLNGRYLLGTLAANGDVGTTGGSLNLAGSSATTSAVSGGTPAGTVSTPTVTMDSYTPTGTNGTGAVTGTTINSVTPTINAAGAIAWPTAPTNVPTMSGITVNAVATGSSTFKGTNSGGFSTIGGVAPGSSFTPTINSQGTLAWPTKVPTLSGTTINSFTATINAGGSAAAETFTGAAHILTGTISTPSFSGSLLGTHTHTVTATGTIQPSYLALIGCKKN